MYATAKDDKADLAGKTQQASAHAGQAVHRIKADISDAADRMKNDLEGMARSAGKQVRDLADSAEETATDAAATVTAKIRENPVQSSMIALGVGVLVGLLFFRRS